MVGSVNNRKGFTLIELLVVVALIALAFGYSSSVVYRGLQKTDTKEALFQLKGRLQKARELSIVAGSRLDTPRIDAGGGCAPGTEDAFLYINVTGTTITTPVGMTVDAGQLQIACLDLDTTTARNANWQIDPASFTGIFAFGPTGALISPGGLPGPPGGIYIEFDNPSTNDTFGLHIFPSGVICQASAFQTCLEDTGP